MSGRKWFIAAAATIGVISGWMYFSSDDRSHQPAARDRSFGSYRAEFRKPDGTLPSDDELMAQLVAKGIPFKPDAGCEKSLQACKETPQRTQKVKFAPGTFSAEAQLKISEKLGANLDRHEKELFRVFTGIQLERAEVTAQKKLHLYFNEQFAALAQDEGSLNDFSESLNELGSMGFKGIIIHIGARTLGEFMQELDARRNAEALRLQPMTGSAR